MTNKNGPNKRDPDPKNRRPGGGPPGPKYPRNIYTWVLFGMLALMMLMMLTRGQRTEEITMDEFWARIDNNEVKKVAIAHDYLIGNMDPEKMAGKGPGSEKDDFRRKSVPSHACQQK